MVVRIIFIIFEILIIKPQDIMIYIIIDTKGNDYGAIESFKSKISWTKYIVKNNVYKLNKVSELLDDLQDGSSDNRDNIYDSLESHTFQTKEEFNSFVNGLESVSLHGFDTYKVFYIDVQDEEWEEFENFNKKDEVKKILIQKITYLGMDIPNNIADIVQYCFEDILECADKDNWSDGDVIIAFRRWIEGENRLI